MTHPSPFQANLPTISGWWKSVGTTEIRENTSDVIIPSGKGRGLSSLPTLLPTPLPTASNALATHPPYTPHRLEGVGRGLEAPPLPTGEGSGQEDLQE